MPRRISTISRCRIWASNLRRKAARWARGKLSPRPPHETRKEAGMYWLPMLGVTTVLLAGAPSPAVDYTKIDRTIAKEPRYQSKTPKYCLLVFGPEAKTRVWLVLDRDVLYVDRN